MLRLIRTRRLLLLHSPNLLTSMNQFLSGLGRSQLQTHLLIAVLSSVAVTFTACEQDDEITGGGIQPPPNSCLPSNLENGLLAWYKFSSGSLEDSSGGGYDLDNSTSASPGADRTGSDGCAYSFQSANNEYLTFANPAHLDGLTELSVSLWFKPDAQDLQLINYLVQRGEVSESCSSLSRNWMVAIFDCKRPLMSYADHNIWWTNTPAPGSSEDCSFYESFMESQWHHLVAIYDANGLQLWLDGAPSLYGTQYLMCGMPIISDAQGDFFIGKDYDGLLDDVAVYDRVLTPAEIEELRLIAPCCQ
ncbi:MAG: LamG domain-containing protein [Pseudomonadota bacterium]